LFGFRGPLEDRLAIRELLVAHGDAISRLCVQNFGILWTADAEWRHLQVGSSLGREAIVEMCRGAMTFTGVMGALSIDGGRGHGRNHTSELVTDSQTRRPASHAATTTNTSGSTASGCSRAAPSICCIRRRLAASPIATIAGRILVSVGVNLSGPGAARKARTRCTLGGPGRFQSRGRAQANV
jgi:hypothetical protein